MKSTFFLIISGGLLATSSFAQTPRYTIRDLGTLGGTSSSPFGIDSQGRVGGGSNTKGETQHPFLWNPHTGMRDLGTLGGPNGNVGAPDALNRLAGLSETSRPDPNGEDFCGFGNHLQCLPVVYKDWKLVALPTLGGTNGLASTINSTGQAAGTAENGIRDPDCVAPQVLRFKPAVWDLASERIHELPVLPGDTVGFALNLNDQGQVVGSTGTCANVTNVGLIVGPHAVLWENGVPKDLGSLGGAHLNVAAAINNAGQVVGGSELPDGSVHTFLWTKDTGMRDLGGLGSNFMTIPFGINNKGQVVGGSCNGPQDCQAYLWQESDVCAVGGHTGITDLNSLIAGDSPYHLIFAFGINDAGEIVGQAVDKRTGELRAYIATPITDQGGKSFANSDHDPGALPDSLRQRLRDLIPRR